MRPKQDIRTSTKKNTRAQVQHVTIASQLWGHRLKSIIVQINNSSIPYTSSTACTAKGNSTVTHQNHKILSWEFNLVVLIHFQISFLGRDSHEDSFHTASGGWTPMSPPVPYPRVGRDGGGCLWPSLVPCPRPSSDPGSGSQSNNNVGPGRVSALSKVMREQSGNEESFG